MGSSAEKLLERIRQSSANCKREELIALYEAYGFSVRNGTNHDIAAHPEFPILRATIPRHNKLAVVYFRMAVKLVDRLIVLRSEAKEDDGHEGASGTSG